MKKLIGLLVSIALLTGLLAGCAEAPAGNNGQTPTSESNSGESTPETREQGEESAWPRTVEDDFGHQVTLEKKPERVAILYFGHIENLIVLGNPPIGAAWADTAMNGFGTLKQYVGEIDIIDLGNPREPNMERILEISPDLIVGTAAHAEAYENLNKIAPTLLFNSSDWKDNLNDYSKALGAEKEAEQYIDEVDNLMAQGREKLSSYSDKTFVVAWDQGKGIFGAFGTKATSQQSFYDNEIGLGLTAPEGYPEEWGQIPLESIAGFDPDYIFIVGSLGSEENGYEQTYLREDTPDSGIWKSLKAVKSGNVYFLDAAGVTGSPLGVKLAIETIVESVVKE